jgi:hypothetical protein
MRVPFLVICVSGLMACLATPTRMTLLVRYSGTQAVVFGFQS